ncbi:MAG: hypothetical protein AB1410_03820 [Acidobacteriota bacterium]
MLSPDIFIEIGTSEQKELMTSEIKNFLDIIGKIFKIWFDILLIPKNFEQTVRDLTFNHEYSTKRGRINAQAKFIKNNGEKILVLSPEIFTEAYDTQVRFHLYFHETNHFINSIEKPNYKELSISEQVYMENISVFYEEYCAERFSLAICEKLFSTKSVKYVEYILNCCQGHFEIISDIEHDFNETRRLLNEFRKHKNGDKFIKDIRPIIEPPLLSYFYLLAFNKESSLPKKEIYSNFPAPFNKTASKKMAELCHRSFPEPLKPTEVLESVIKFFAQFGFEFETIRPSLIFVRIVDV